MLKIEGAKRRQETPIEFNADHPFLLVFTVQQHVLFVGRVGDV
jgi:hypothetical protein